MSGPYCETCDYFVKLLDYGECTDPSKRIYGSGGSPVNEQPLVWPMYGCDNHKEKSEIKRTS